MLVSLSSTVNVNVWFASAAASDTPSAADQVQPEPEEEETELTDGLPDTDMQGFELNILHHSQDLSTGVLPDIAFSGKCF